MCVPCQVIIWNGRMMGMLQAATALATAEINHPSGPGHARGWPGNDWGKEFYDAVKECCEKIGPILERAGQGAQGGAGT